MQHPENKDQKGKSENYICAKLHSCCVILDLFFVLNLNGSWVRFIYILDSSNSSSFTF